MSQNPPVSLCIAEDRAVMVRSDQKVVTGYVDVFKIRHACRDRIAPEAVQVKVQRLLQCGDGTPFPCPNGFWSEEEDGVFILYDGRHEHIASIMLGRLWMLVAWTEAR